MLPLERYKPRWPVDPNKPAPKVKNFVNGKNIFVVDVDDYELYRSALYALGAQSVANKMMANVNLILHGHSEAPAKARTKYPKGEFVSANDAVNLFHQEIQSFGDFVKALEKHGFTVRNPSDEGDARFDYFELPLVANSLHETLLEYLKTSQFIRKFATKQYFPIDKRDDGYIDFPVPGTDLIWYYAWNSHAWGRVHALRGEGDYPLDIKGEQLLRIAPVFWTQTTGMYFHEYPTIESITGLFIQAGIDSRSGLVHGIAISRVWT